MAQLGSIYNRNAAENYPDSARNRGRIATGRRRRMSQLKADFLIIGSSPLARLLAGLLASRHGKTVLLQARHLAGRRVRPGMHLSVGAITRPESWALLAATVPETTRLLRRIGTRGVLRRLDPILFADQAWGQAALGHIRHMAAGFGLAAERLPLHRMGPDREGLVLRDAVLLNRPVLEPALDRWLVQLGVRRLDPDMIIDVAGDGRAVVTLEDARIEIGQTLLADDAAILNHVPDFAWPALLHRQDASLILTRPVPPIAAPVMLALDAGIVLQQQQEGGVLGQGKGDIVGLAGQLGVLLGLPDAFEQAGQASIVSVSTRDGAPALGRVGGVGPDILAGFGPVGAFLAPALARWLCGVASPAENAWCGARLVNRDGGMAPVSDIGAMP